MDIKIMFVMFVEDIIQLGMFRLIVVLNASTMLVGIVQNRLQNLHYFGLLKKGGVVSLF